MGTTNAKKTAQASPRKPTTKKPAKKSPAAAETKPAKKLGEKKPEPAATGHGAGNQMEAVDADLAERMTAQAWAAIDKQAALFKARTVVPNKQRKGWVTARVFVSSTFADMFSEREVLVRQVFPRLRSWCDQQRIRIVECDLRWGVPKDSTTEDIIRTCLGELDRCIQENTNPFFINLLSERYGWIPTAEQVPAAVAAYIQAQGLYRPGGHGAGPAPV
mgnify:CR=1 FL=1